MASVTFPTSLGGSGQTISDDADPNTGLANGGHRVRFIPALSGSVDMASTAVSSALDAENFKNLCQTLRNEAQSFRDDAATSESNALTSEQNASTSESNALTSEQNALASENKANEWAENPENVEVEPGEYSAKHWAAKAQESVIGDLIDDTTTSETTVWSSYNTDYQDALGTPDWPSSLTYDGNGDLTQVVFSKGTQRVRQTLSYTSGDLSSVLYERSENSGSTWTTIGTETLNYSGGNLVSTSWT